MENLEAELESLRYTIHNRQKKVLTVAVIGQNGTGKSSFINTVMAVFSGEYHERALVGRFQEQGRHMTYRLARYPNEMYNENNADALNYKYPTLVDMVGFQNANDVNTRGNLGFVFNGCIEEGTRLNIDAPNQRSGLDMFLDKYYDDENRSKVDRIIFVASASSILNGFPSELIRAVLSQARDGKRDIPIFGVLTHADKVKSEDEEFKCLEEKFKECLGLTTGRYLLCSSYCDVKPRLNDRSSDVEVPVARFLKEVMDPARETYEELPNTVEQIFHHLNFKLKTILEYFIIFFITIFYISFIMDSSSNVKHFCDINKADISSMPYICQLNSEGKIMDKSSMHYFNFIIFPCIYLGVKIMIRSCMKYHPDINAALNQRIKTYFQTK